MVTIAHKTRRLLAASTILCIPSLALAGGGGENMLLIVDPNNEAALRMANAYAADRAIPVNNIVYIATPRAAGAPLLSISSSQYQSVYQSVINNAITSRGLSGQIDYIGTFGTPQNISDDGGNTGSIPFTDALAYNRTLTTSNTVTSQLASKSSSLFGANISLGKLNYTTNTNTAIHGASQYVTGMIGYSGTQAITTQQYIDAYARAAAGDGAKPAGTVYFMDNSSDIRSTTRSPSWPAVQAYMTAHGIAWQQISAAGDSVAAPQNKSDVVGAVVGSPQYNMPAGSTYLPGSYADNLTSFGGLYYSAADQTKADKFIAAGAAGTAGSVVEPFAIASRFTAAQLYVYQHEGSTLGEAFAKSLSTPDKVMFQGDLLAQPYADVPNVTLSGLSGSPVSGSISIHASASLTSPAIATSVASLELFVDGKSKGSLSASSGAFNLDTTSLTDGQHQIRVVAYNNAAAASQGYSLSNINVSNKGQSVSITGASSIEAAWNQALSLPVQAQVGTGTAVDHIDLRSLGRTVGTLAGTSGKVSFNVGALAYGSNSLVPVAVLTDGQEVNGSAITVTRDFHQLVGQTITPPASRRPGFLFQFYSNIAGNTLAQTNFNQTPTVTTTGNTQLALNTGSIPSQFFSNNNINAGTAIRASALFDVTTAGEYSFWYDDAFNSFLTNPNRATSMQVLIDGTTVMNYDLWNGTSFDSPSLSTGVDSSSSIYLLTGEHSLQVLLAFATAQPNYLNEKFWYRGPDGNSNVLTSADFFNSTIIVPEPSSMALLALGGAALLRRSRSR